MCRYVVGDELSDQRIRIGAGPRRRGAKLCGEIGSNHLLRVQPLRAPSFPWSLRYLDNSRSPRGPRDRFGALGRSVVGAIGGYVGGYLLDAAMVLNGSNALHVSRLLDQGASEPRFNRLQ
jgi:hypothetical protein